MLFPGLSLHPAVGATRPEAQRRCHIGQGHFLRIGQGRSHKNGGRTSAGNVGRFCHSIHRSIHSSIYLIESIYNVYIIIYACLHVYTYACTYVESTNMDAYIYIHLLNVPWSYVGRTWSNNLPSFHSRLWMMRGHPSNKVNQQQREWGTRMSSWHFRGPMMRSCSYGKCI